MGILVHIKYNVHCYTVEKIHRVSIQANRGRQLRLGLNYSEQPSSAGWSSTSTSNVWFCEDNLKKALNDKVEGTISLSLLQLFNVLSHDDSMYFRRICQSTLNTVTIIGNKEKPPD